jgi:hypothetical protein
MSFPVEIKRDNKLWLIYSLLALACLVFFALIWWAGSQPFVTRLFNPVQKNSIPSEEKLPEEIIQKIDLTRGTPQKIIRNPSHADTHEKNSNQVESKPEAKTAMGQSMKADPLIGLPVLNISGYIHEEQGGSIAMINNKLIHEGEEVTPGLKLVKILDGSAIFSYKGYVFTR